MSNLYKQLCFVLANIESPGLTTVEISARTGWDMRRTRSTVSKARAYGELTRTHCGVNKDNKGITWRYCLSPMARRAIMAESPPIVPVQQALADAEVVV